MGVLRKSVYVSEMDPSRVIALVQVSGAQFFTLTTGDAHIILDRSAFRAMANEMLLWLAMTDHEVSGQVIYPAAQFVSPRQED